jgi:hypothetical protein
MKTILITILTSGITSGFVLGLYRHFLSRNIESYKNDLLYDLQRKVHDFQLFAAKKHEKYAELYGSLQIATDEILNVTSPLQFYPPFREYTEEEIDKYLEQHNLIQANKLRIKSLSKNEMQREIQKLVEHEKIVKADKLRISAYKNYSQTLIYQSQEVIKICDEITSIHRELLIDHDYYKEAEVSERKAIREKLAAHKENLKNLHNELHKVMQSELTVGYYEKLKEKVNN